MNILSHAENIHDPEPLMDEIVVKNNILAVNKKAASDYAEYNNVKNAFTSQKRIITHCSDGRIDMSIFYENPLERFRNPIVPFAGIVLILKDAFRNAKTAAELDIFYSQNTAYVNNLFENIFNRLIKENPGAIIDLQSHSSAPDSAHHGCGAHASHTANALTETAKLAYLLSKWNPALNIIRTHNCTDEGVIYPASQFDKEALDDKGNKIGIGEFANITAQFDSPAKFTGKMKKNHFNINMKNHAEQMILVSNTPFAHHHSERPALRLAWHPEAEFLAIFIKKLAGIIQKNYLARNPGAPMILHLDNQNLEQINDLAQKIAEDKKLQVLTVKTATNPITYKTQII